MYLTNIYSIMICALIKCAARASDLLEFSVVLSRQKTSSTVVENRDDRINEGIFKQRVLPTLIIKNTVAWFVLGHGNHLQGKQSCQK